MAEPGLMKNLLSISNVSNLCVWPVIRMSTSSCRCSIPSDSRSPHGTTCVRVRKTPTKQASSQAPPRQCLGVALALAVWRSAVGGRHEPDGHGRDRYGTSPASRPWTRDSSRSTSTTRYTCEHPLAWGHSIAASYVGVCGYLVKVATDHLHVGRQRLEVVEDLLGAQVADAQDVLDLVRHLRSRQLTHQHTNHTSLSREFKLARAFVDNGVGDGCCWARSIPEAS